MSIVGLHILPEHDAQFARRLVFIDGDAIVFKSSKKGKDLSRVLTAHNPRYSACTGRRLRIGTGSLFTCGCT